MHPAMIADADRALVARQLGREPRTLRGVAVRCPFGAPAVTEQSPYGADGEPFPTTYYVTCRHLVATVSRLEAAGDNVTVATLQRALNVMDRTLEIRSAMMPSSVDDAQIRAALRFTPGELLEAFDGNYAEMRAFANEVQPQVARAQVA